MEDELIKIVTLTEAARLWGKHPTSVRRARDSKRNPLVVRETDRVWLISVASLRRRWGSPKIPLSTLLK
jgi:hypothetical protein